MKNESMLSNYNDRQREAILTTKGSLLVLAGAGSGKTRVVTGKIAYLIESENVSPFSILAITFTNKAAKEMQERVADLLTYPVEGMWISTFHAMCVRILRRHIEAIGYDQNFAIYDASDQKTLIKTCMNELNLSKEIYKPYGLLSKISAWKTEGISPEEAVKNHFGEFHERQIAEAYRLYEKKKRENNALDFDDLLVKTVELFQEHPDVLSYYQQRFAYIFVDEYQDTNHIQYLLVKMLAEKAINLTVVGDNDQSIYSWRGADIENILSFERDFPDAKTIMLEQNYRSTTPILKSANRLIANNPTLKKKNLWTEREGGDPVVYREFYHSSEEEMAVVRKMEHLNYKGTRFGDMAILYRTNAQSRGFEEALMREGIPYRVVGGLRFYDRREIKDAISYLQVIDNPKDDVSLRRIVNVPKRGIGETTIEQLQDYADEKGQDLFAVMEELEDNDEIKVRAHKNIKEFVNLIHLLTHKREELSLGELVEAILFESHYVEELRKEDTVTSRTRIENLDEFISAASEFEHDNPDLTLTDFLGSLSLISDKNELVDEDASVQLMTIHGAKGLEFPVVFVVGLEEGLFPTSRSLDDEKDMEEERRLMYVAMTRAKEKLFLSSAKSRTLYGKRKPAVRSRFIREVEDVIDVVEEESVKKDGRSRHQIFTGTKTASAPLKPKQRTQVPEEDFSVGDTVIHKKWGEGMIVQLKGDEGVVAFSGKGLKTLNLKIAPVRKKD
ncbi:MAG: UvrD-helicase domain-containing protein [Peptoniphilus sp.]|nr:UvrD-helicase domain-containing protein [Peptoniphilus sp.]MDD7363107.1 UvrD-helicase domain-containing protein [Bacillota bacterium]MDY6044371.1 UvrD-helicase domain-containing protein [Peptoniphilus sp.]